MTARGLGRYFEVGIRGNRDGNWGWKNSEKKRIEPTVQRKPASDEDQLTTSKKSRQRGLRGKGIKKTKGRERTSA